MLVLEVPEASKFHEPQTAKLEWLEFRTICQPTSTTNSNKNKTNTKIVLVGFMGFIFNYLDASKKVKGKRKNTNTKKLSD